MAMATAAEALGRFKASTPPAAAKVSSRAETLAHSLLALAHSPTRPLAHSFESLALF